MSTAFNKLWRHSDHKIETEMVNLYAIIANLRQQAIGVNASAYAQALKNEWADHELDVLERYFTGSTLGESIHLHAKENLGGRFSDFKSALYVDTSQITPAGLAKPVYFSLSSAAGLDLFQIVASGSPAPTSVLAISNAAGGYCLRARDNTGGSSSIVFLDSPGSHSGNYIETDNGAVCNNAGAWVNGSSAALKDIEDVADVDDVLGDIRDIPLHRYRMKSDASGPVYMGAMAEDWNRIFGDRSPGGIGGVDAAMVSLAGVQSLAKKVEALEERIRQLEASHAP